MSEQEKSTTLQVNVSKGSSNSFDEALEKDAGGAGATTLQEVKHYTPSEIESSGKFYDKRYVPFLPAYSNATIQIVMLAFVVFMTPGMYNALTGIGASISGPDGVKTQDNSTVALYCTFAGLGFFAGTFCNLMGPRYCLMFGGTGYLIYAGSLLSYNHNRRLTPLRIERRMANKRKEEAASTLLGGGRDTNLPKDARNRSRRWLSTTQASRGSL